MKHTIIECDLCNGRIYRDGIFHNGNGSVKLRTKALKPFVDEYMPKCVMYSQWKRIHRSCCPDCTFHCDMR